MTLNSKERLSKKLNDHLFDKSVHYMQKYNSAQFSTNIRNWLLIYVSIVTQINKKIYDGEDSQL